MNQLPATHRRIVGWTWCDSRRNAFQCARVTKAVEKARVLADGLARFVGALEAEAEVAAVWERERKEKLAASAAHGE